MLINHLPDTAAFTLRIYNMQELLSEEKQILPKANTSFSPKVPDEATSMVIEMSRGKLKLHGERERQGNEEDPIERDYFISGGKRTFWLNPSRSVNITLVGDSQDSEITNLVYRVTDRDGVKEENLTLKDGQTKKLTFGTGAKSFVCGIERGGGLVVMIRQ